MDIPLLGRLTGALLIAALLFPPQVSAPAEPPSAPALRSAQAVTSEEVLDASVLADALRTDASLPVAEVEVLAADSERGVAIFLPQTHIRPGTDPFDPVNDTALAVQREHRAIINNVTDIHGVGIALVEGALVDEPLGDEVARLRTATEQTATLNGHIESLAARLEEKDASSAAAVRAGMQAFARDIERVTLLKGAPYVAAAENDALQLAGAENPATKEASGEILRRYVYQEDRLAQLRSGIATADPAAVLKQQLLAELQRTLRAENLAAIPLAGSAGNRKAGSLVTTLKEARQAAAQSGDEALQTELAAAIDEAKSIAALLAPPAALTAAAPNRADNPYSGVTDPTELQRLMEETEEDIQAVIIDQRNRETADAFVAALAEQGETAGILQFGLGHTDELARELQARGITVIIVRSDTVAARFAKDFNAME